MPISRLGVQTPTANTPTILSTFNAAHLVSVLITNTSSSANPVLKVDIWIAPQGALFESEYAYIAKNLIVGSGQSFETFRFAVNNGDTIYVQSTTASVSFTCNGIQQDDEIKAEDLPQTFTNKTIRGAYNTIYLDKGTTAQRPTDVETGYARYNTELEMIEIKTVSGWSFAGAGLDGPQGPTGPTGPQGPIGLQAVNLNLKGSVADVASLPATGNTKDDGYYVADQNTMYAWSDADTWVNVGPIYGAQGPTGADSTVTGPTGATGPTGPEGNFTVSATAPSTPLEGDAWFNSNNSRMYVYYDSVWVETSSNTQGPTGPTGAQGLYGGPHISYGFDTDTNTAVAPLDGSFKLDNASLNSVTSIVVDTNDVNNANVIFHYVTMEAVTSTPKATIQIADKLDDTQRWNWQVTAVDIFGTPNQVTLSVSPGDFNGAPPTFTLGQELALSYRLSGNLGSTGPTGPGVTNYIHPFLTMGA